MSQPNSNVKYEKKIGMNSFTFMILRHKRVAINNDESKDKVNEIYTTASRIITYIPFIILFHQNFSSKALGKSSEDVPSHFR